MQVVFMHGLPLLFMRTFCILAGTGVLAKAFQQSRKPYKKEQKDEYADYGVLTHGLIISQKTFL
jgi:hypothetical protein